MKRFFTYLLLLFLYPTISAQTVSELEARFKPEQTINTFYNDGAYEWRTIWDNIGFFISDVVYELTPESQTTGFSYQFSDNFPISLSANYTYSVLSISGEIGINMDKNKYLNNTYNPLGYYLVSPGLYFRYFSINYGVGSMFGLYEETIKGDNYEITDDEGNVSIQITTGNRHIVEWGDAYLLFKPSITGYIPISGEDYYITINAGYNYIPKFKELNGWSFGIGFQWVIW